MIAMYCTYLYKLITVNTNKYYLFMYIVKRASIFLHLDYSLCSNIKAMTGGR